MRPRSIAAATPIATLRTTQRIAAPSTSDSVTGAARAIWGRISAPRFE